MKQTVNIFMFHKKKAKKKYTHGSFVLSILLDFQIYVHVTEKKVQRAKKKQTFARLNTIQWSVDVIKYT